MATRRRRAGTVGAMAMELTVAATLLALLVPQDKVLCRAGSGHEALESVLAACCGATESGAGCASPLATPPGANAGGEDCTDLAVAQPSMFARPQPVLPGGLIPAGSLDAFRRDVAVPAAILSAGGVRAPTLACVRATILLI